MVVWLWSPREHEGDHKELKGFKTKHEAMVDSGDKTKNVIFAFFCMFTKTIVFTTPNAF